MVLFNHATREMTAKIVYYGPGLCGKTTNLLVIYDKLDPKTKGKMLSLATRSDRTLFFDLLPVELGKVGTFNLKMQLYTVPGQVFYNETRKLVLRGADAVVFVVDSQPSLLSSNRESFENLLENLRENRIDADDLPLVVQYNKRDISGVLSVREIQKHVGLDRYPSIEASAIRGEGVMETFKLVSKLTAKKLLQKMNGRELPAEELRQTAEPEPLPEPAAYSAAQDSAPSPDPARFNLANIAPADLGPTLTRGEVSPPFDEQYEKMEEVSLEQLLEGRDRPLTMKSGEDRPSPPSPEMPADEIEDLTEQDLIPDQPESTAEVFKEIHAATAVTEIAPAGAVTDTASATTVGAEPSPVAEPAPAAEVGTEPYLVAQAAPAAEVGAEPFVEYKDPLPEPDSTFAPLASTPDTPSPAVEAMPETRERGDDDQLRAEVEILKAQLAALQSRQEQIVSALQKVVAELSQLARDDQSG